MAVRIGLMGCGVVAGYGHLPVLQRLPGVELAALFDPDANRVREMAGRFGAGAACTSVESFFSHRLDAVAITSPAPCHLRNIQDAAGHGAHVLCEKPLAMDDAEAEAAIAAARAAGVQLFTGFDYRFSPAALAIRDAIRHGDIGAVRSLRLVYIWNCHGKTTALPDGRRVENERRAGRMHEGGPMVDCGVHQIDLARWWLGSEVVAATGHGAWVDEYEAPDHVYGHLDHANGAHTMVEISYSYCHTTADVINHFTYEIIGSRGLIRYDRNASSFVLRNDTGTRVLPYAQEKNFEGMYRAFVQAVTNPAAGAGDLATAEDGMIATRLARQITASAVASRRHG